MIHIGKFTVFCLLAVIFYACVPNKKIIYLQNKDGGIPIADGQVIAYEIPEYRLQYNDIIDIDIKTVEDLLRDGFNVLGQNQSQNNNMMGQVAQSGGDIYYMNGYNVDKNGNIRLPMIGELYIRDKTIDEARLIIEEKVKSLVKTELFVKVKLGGIRYSALGEFRKPGKFVVLQDRMTIFEAIAHAGDLTNVAKRTEIVLIRQHPEGTEIHKVDLTDRRIVQSPFYFIQPNDQLYAEPLKIRELGSGENASQSLAMIISSITAVLLILNFVTR
jgi:polysaccharide export outer membrane protein